MPSAILSANCPSFVVGSKTNSSMTIEPLSPKAKVVSSMKIKPTAAPSPVSMVSPWKMESPLERVTVLPVARVTVTVPLTSSALPMGSAVWAISTTAD